MTPLKKEKQTTNYVEFGALMVNFDVIDGKKGDWDTPDDPSESVIRQMIYTDKQGNRFDVTAMVSEIDEFGIIDQINEKIDNLINQ